MKYSKINTLWKRDEKSHNLIEGEYSCEEFNNIDLWRATEKICIHGIEGNVIRRVVLMYNCPKCRKKTGEEI